MTTQYLDTSWGEGQGRIQLGGHGGEAAQAGGRNRGGDRNGQFLRANNLRISTKCSPAPRGSLPTTSPTAIRGNGKRSMISR